MGRNNKICFKCGLVKDLELFYKHPGMADGHLNKCIECARSDSGKRFKEKIKDPEFVDSERKRGRSKYHKYKYKSSTTTESRRKWSDKFPEKRQANIVVSSVALDFMGAERHHWSYNVEHQLDVIQLSKKDHSKAHRFLIYDQDKMMYRATDGTLLDTRESHKKYIFHKINTEED